MSFKKPVIYVTDTNTNRKRIFMYKYSENRISIDAHHTIFEHYQHFRNEVFCIIKRDYENIDNLKFEMNKISFMQYLIHNIHAKAEDMIYNIPALDKDKEVNEFVSLSRAFEMNKNTSNNNEENEDCSNTFYCKSLDEIFKLEESGIIYNNAMLLINDKLYIYNNGSYYPVEDDNLIAIKNPDSGNVSHDKT